MRPRTGAAAELVWLAHGRKARVATRLGYAERANDPFSSIFRGPSQQQMENGPFPAEYKKHEHSAKRVNRVRGVPVVRWRFDRPRDHFEYERDAHQAEQL